MVERAVGRLVKERQLDLVVANAENGAGGSGLTPAIYYELMEAGVDGITLGDHIYRRREICNILTSKENIVKAANLPSEAPGREWMVIRSPNDTPVAVVSLLGRLFMPPIDCPWKAIDRVLPQLPGDVKVILVDFHAEATSEMQLMGRYLDGRVSAVLGTHTHVATADECILSGGTAFQCDVGMTGPYDGILGRRYDRVIETTLTRYPRRFDVSAGDLRLSGSIVDVDPETGRAKGIERVCVRGDL